jgi:hypothetical protein
MHHPELQVDCNLYLYNLRDLAKFYTFTLSLKFLYEQTPDDDRLARNM